ncbi:MAG: GNAT family protein [Pseudomonadota bacterium]
MQDPHNRHVLTDGTVTLRAPREADIEARFALGRSPEILKWFGIETTTLTPYTRDRAQEWFEVQSGSEHTYMIEHDGALTGEVFLHSVDMKDLRAEIAIGILNPDKLGQGIGTAALRLLMGHAFDTMGLNRIGLRYLDGNDRARACYDKLGFVEEGRLRERAKVGDVFHDDIQMSCLAREFVR